LNSALRFRLDEFHVEKTDLAGFSAEEDLALAQLSLLADQLWPYQHAADNQSRDDNSNDYHRSQAHGYPPRVGDDYYTEVFGRLSCTLCKTVAGSRITRSAPP